MYYQPEVIYREEKQERKNSILRYIGNRVLTSNKNFLCAIVGKTGDGKSWGGLAMIEDYSEMFDIPFDPKVHVISSLKQLLELIVNKELQKNIRVGTPILFEEPQVETSADEWQSELSKMLSILLSTFRNQRLVIFFTLPYLNMLPKKSRALLHAEFKVLGFDKSTGITTVKPRFLEYNQDMDKFYRKRLLIMYKVKDKRHLAKTKLNKWYVDRASDMIIQSYEEYKKRMTEDINKMLYQKAIQHEEQSKENRKSEEFVKIKELYLKYGENYIKILQEMPHMSVYGVQNQIKMLKKSLKEEESIKALT